MRTFIGELFVAALLVTWMLGIVLAKGFWSTSFAIFIPPYAWYLAVERVALHFGLI